MKRDISFVLSSKIGFILMVHLVYFTKLSLLLSLLRGSFCKCEQMLCITCDIICNKFLKEQIEYLNGKKSVAIYFKLPLAA